MIQSTVKVQARQSSFAFTQGKKSVEDVQDQMQKMYKELSDNYHDLIKQINQAKITTTSES